MEEKNRPKKAHIKRRGSESRELKGEEVIVSRGLKTRNNKGCQTGERIRRKLFEIQFQILAQLSYEHQRFLELGSGSEAVGVRD